MRDFDQLVAARILHSLAALTVAEPEEAIQRIIGAALFVMETDAILELRSEVAAQFDANVPLIRNVMCTIDGQLALREIAQQSEDAPRKLEA